MRSAISTQIKLDDVIAELGDHVGTDWDACVVFVTHEFADEWGRLGHGLRERLGLARVLGCSAEGVVGSRREQEEGPAVSLLAIRWPNTSVTPVHLQFERTVEGGAIVGWPDELIGDWPEDATLLLLAEPFSFPADYFLQLMNDERNGLPVLGGMASGAAEPGANRLFLNDATFDSGAIGWLVHGPSLRTVVSQGCRPIGEPMVVTAAEQNLIQSLGGKPALEKLQHLFATLPTHEQQLMQQGLQLGRVVSEYQEKFEMGDFLIRSVLGIDQRTKAVAVGDFIRPGQTVQFHLRDQHTASSELVQLLARFAPDETPAGGLLFTCNGRGTRLFSDPHHDAQKIADRFGDLPLAGFFAQGEIGPVGGSNFLHGYTASLLLFG